MDKELSLQDINNRIGRLEQHIINLIIPIQNISEVIRNPNALSSFNNSIQKLMNQLQKFIKIDDNGLKHAIITFQREIGDFTKTLNEIKFLSKHVMQLEEKISKLEESGISQNLTIDIFQDRYKMVKEPVAYDSSERVKPPVATEDEKINEVLSTLLPKEAEVLKYRFGLLGENKKTLKETGKIIGVQAERVRQIQAKCIRKLNHTRRIELVRQLKNCPLKEAVIG